MLIHGLGAPTPLCKPKDSLWQSFAGSRPCITLVYGWLQECLKSHVKCRRQVRSKQPSRLLDLRCFGDSLDVKLVECPKKSRVKYVTLSWSWGKQVPLKTTKSSLQSHLQRMDFDLLPQTFKDAITVLRRLGFSYLWIDALCIVQDDRVNFEAELLQMDSIYAGSICTIAVADADSYQGFLKSRWPLSNQDCWLTVEGNVNLTAFADDVTVTNSMPGSSKLDGRAWVCQERALSLRTIYYGQRHIYWECRERILHEKPNLDEPVNLQSSLSLR